MLLGLVLACQPPDTTPTPTHADSFGGQIGESGDDLPCLAFDTPIDDPDAPVGDLGFPPSVLLARVEGASTGTLTLPEGDPEPLSLEIRATGGIAWRSLQPREGAEPALCVDESYVAPIAIAVDSDTVSFSLGGEAQISASGVVWWRGAAPFPEVGTLQPRSIGPGLWPILELQIASVPSDSSDGFGEIGWASETPLLLYEHVASWVAAP